MNKLDNSIKTKNSRKPRALHILFFLFLTGLLLLSYLIPGELVSAQENSPTPAPVLMVKNSADTESMEEPGGIVTFRLEIANQSASSLPVTITVLEDDVYGDLNGQGTCSVPQTIAAGELYSCSFDALLTTTGTGTVNILGMDNEGMEVSGFDGAPVTIVNAIPVIVVAKTADPESIAKPGGNVSFGIEINNNSVSSDPVTISVLEDDIHGDLMVRALVLCRRRS